jgi:hypothetical protein
VTSLISTYVYLSSDQGDDVISASFVWTIVGGLTMGFIFSFTSFLLVMKRGYWATFVSTKTGYQYVQSKFLREGDENKGKIFK